MKKSRLKSNVKANMDETHEALQTLWGNINQGQRKQLIKIEEIKTLLDRYQVDVAMGGK